MLISLATNTCPKFFLIGANNFINTFHVQPKHNHPSTAFSPPFLPARYNVVLDELDHFTFFLQGIVNHGWQWLDEQLEIVKVRHVRNVQTRTLTHEQTKMPITKTHILAQTDVILLRMPHPHTHSLLTCYNPTRSLRKQ